MAKPLAAQKVTAADVKRAYAKAHRLHQAGRLAEAEQGYRAVAAVAPTLAEPKFQLGRIAASRDDLDGALAQFDAALRIKPKEPAVHAARAEALSRLGSADAALDAYDALIKSAPREIKPRADKALFLQRLGRFDAAEVELRGALKRSPRDGELFRMLAATHKMRKGEVLLRQMLEAHADPSVQGMSRMQLQFALAKAMTDLGEHGKVFSYLNPANAAMRAAQPYTIAQREAEVDALMTAFAGADATPIAPAPEGPTPIFVTGLPRSGTTLVEQILAAHPKVSGAGERRFVLEEAYAVLGNPGQGFRSIHAVPPADLEHFARRYLDTLAAAVPGAEIITDKSIQTHLVLGLVAKALPQAKLIVVRRDPRDIGLSIYRNLFAPGTHLYAYDQADIAAYIASFERMVSFWRRELPGQFTEVSYDALVADPEPQTRALVAAAGLDWDDACLSFHESDRQVATLSIQQVRQPIHAGSTGGWRRYAADLAPMQAAFAAQGVSLP